MARDAYDLADPAEEILMDLTVYGVERSIDQFMREARAHPLQARAHRDRMREYADLLQQEADRL
jgi:hypothetical protein